MFFAISRRKCRAKTKMDSFFFSGTDDASLGVAQTRNSAPGQKLSCFRGVRPTRTAALNQPSVGATQNAIKQSVLSRAVCEEGVMILFYESLQDER